jgi:hypothetical protein
MQYEPCLLHAARPEPCAVVSNMSTIAPRAAVGLIMRAGGPDCAAWRQGLPL